MKLFICAMNGWNPYSEEVKSIPISYWLIAIRCRRYKLYEEWTDMMRPHGEFISSIVAPENYGEWKKYHDQKEKNKKQGLPDTVNMGDSHYASADTYYDPTKGLVSMKTGEVLISDKDMKDRLNIDGIAVSI